MGLDLSKVGERSRLKPRREPHWQRLRAGCFLGYRPSLRGGVGTWIARAYDDAERGYRTKSLGDFGALKGNERFASAKREAETFADKVESGGIAQVKLETVADACRSYAETHPEAKGRFKRFIYDDPIGNVKLDKLRKRHLLQWRKRVEEAPALISRAKKGEQRTRKRAPSTVNRDMASLRAALNQVIAPGTPKTEAAWQEALKAIPNADRQRTLYLDRAQRKSLLENMDAEAKPFFRGLCLLPLRPGALAALTVSDFDDRTSELTIGKDKNGKPRRIKLPAEAKRLFASQVENRKPSDPIFRRSNGAAWDRNTWKVPINEAVGKAELPRATTAYTLRHSTITDLVGAGLPLLTIAQISGTSAEMIERHYGHLASDTATEALATLAI